MDCALTIQPDNASVVPPDAPPLTSRDLDFGTDYLGAAIDDWVSTDDVDDIE